MEQVLTERTTAQEWLSFTREVGLTVRCLYALCDSRALAYVALRQIGETEITADQWRTATDYVEDLDFGRQQEYDRALSMLSAAQQRSMNGYKGAVARHEVPIYKASHEHQAGNDKDITRELVHAGVICQAVVAGLTRDIDIGGMSPSERDALGHMEEKYFHAKPKPKPSMVPEITPVNVLVSRTPSREAHLRTVLNRQSREDVQPRDKRISWSKWDDPERVIEPESALTIIQPPRNSATAMTLFRGSESGTIQEKTDIGIPGLQHKLFENDSLPTPQEKLEAFIRQIREVKHDAGLSWAEAYYISQLLDSYGITVVGNDIPREVRVAGLMAEWDGVSTFRGVEPHTTLMSAKSIKERFIGWVTQKKEAFLDALDHLPILFWRGKTKKAQIM